MRKWPAFAMAVERRSKTWANSYCSDSGNVDTNPIDRTDTRLPSVLCCPDGRSPIHRVLLSNYKKQSHIGKICRPGLHWAVEGH
jgi:hypothetical protein